MKGYTMANQIDITDELEVFGVGDFVGFKYDIENSGKLVSINGEWLTLSVFDGLTGDSYEVDVHRSKAWKE
jgi:hypothetical protein